MGRGAAIGANTVYAVHADKLSDLQPFNTATKKPVKDRRFTSRCLIGSTGLPRQKMFPVHCLRFFAENGREVFTLL